MASTMPGHVLTGSPVDFDPVLRLVGDAQFVLLGEASQRTHELYRIRAEITKRLQILFGIFPVDFFGDGHAVVADEGLAPLTLDEDAFRFGP